jgi:DnaJ-domain-containing protein 1
LHPVIFLALLVGVLLFISWYKRTPSGQQKRIRGRMLLFGGIGIVLLLLVTGHLNPIFALILAALALGQRILAVANMASMFKGFRNSMKGAAGPSTGNASDVETRFLRMSLDHDTGAMEGVVLEGAYRGRRLAELALDELTDLLAVCRAQDSQSATVLEAYLDRVHGDVWRAASHAGGTGHGKESTLMTAAEAREILGVDPDAGRDDIIEAHRRLMQKNHPDRGGSTYLAAKINQAKDVLLA